MTTLENLPSLVSILPERGIPHFKLNKPCLGVQGIAMCVCVTDRLKEEVGRSPDLVLSTEITLDFSS